MMGFVERLAIAALLAFAVVSGAQTADSAVPGTAAAPAAAGSR
jgi:hypothetical protein